MAVLSWSGLEGSLKPGRAFASNRFVKVASFEQATRLPSARIARFLTAPRGSFKSGVSPAKPSLCAVELARMLNYGMSELLPLGITTQCSHNLPCLKAGVDVSQDLDKLYQQVWG